MDALFAELPAMYPEPTSDEKAAFLDQLSSQAVAIVSTTQGGSFNRPRAEYWRETLNDALLKNPNDYPPVLRLAQAIICVDMADTDLDKSKTYIRDMMPKDTELTLIILHHLDQEARIALIEGDFARLKSSPSLPDQLTEVLPTDPVTHNEKDNKSSKSNPNRPILYMHFHVDSQDRKPSLNQYLRAAVYIQSYVDVAAALGKNGSRNPRPTDVEKVEEVDCIVPAPATPGLAAVPASAGTSATPAIPRGTVRFPYVFNKDEPRYGTTQPLVSGLRQWLQAIYELKAATPAHGRDHALKHAMTETGWTIELNIRRFAQLEHGAGGNKIMNVVESAFRAANPGVDHRMRWVIVLEIVRSDLAAPGERTLSRAGSSYTTAGGTNQTLGGISTASAKSINEKAYHEASRSQADRIKSSVAADAEVLARNLEEIEVFDQTCEDWRSLNELKNEAEGTAEKTAQTEVEVEQMGELLLQNGQRWTQEARAEMMALREQERMKELASKLQDQLELFKR